MFGGLIASALSAGLNSGGGGDDDWTPPDGWLDIPEPNPYQITILVDTNISGNVQMALRLVDDKGGTGISGKPFVDWGDGTIEHFIEGVSYTAHHIYNKTGQYIITINGTENENVLYFVTQSSYWTSLLAIKFGTLMGIYTNTLTQACPAVVYIKFKGKPIHYQNRFSFAGLQALAQIDFEGEYPDDEDFFNEGATVFSDCYSLQKIPFTKKLKTIYANMFRNCYSLKEIDLSSVTTIITANAFSGCYNLKKINAPLLETIDNDFNQLYSLEEVNTPSLVSVGETAFFQCYRLKKFTYADICNFNGNTFSTCVQLYPKPQ